MSQITKDVRIPTGKGPDGKPEMLVVGFCTEENFGKGNVRRRVWLHTSVLNPVLFQQVKPFTQGSSYVCLEPVDLSRRYKGPDSPEGEETGTGGQECPRSSQTATDPDEYAQEGEPGNQA